MNFIKRSKPGRKKTRKDNDECLVCGDQAIGINFGVHTCAPCKAFFRRNAIKLGMYEFQCLTDGDCRITVKTRRQCNCCRLAKCFRVGMDRQSIRTDDQRLERNRLIEFNRQKRAETQHQIIRSSNLSNYNSSSLSLNDQNCLTNIFDLYEQTCVTLRYQQYLNRLNNEKYSLEKFMNSCGDMYMALIQYFKFVPEFSSLSYSLKTSLIKNNLNQIFRINNALVSKITDTLDDPNSTGIINFFPPNLYIDLCKCAAALSPFLNDPILVKLIIIVLLFSTHLSVRYENDFVDNEDDYSTYNLLNAQNIYVELLWRYIISRSLSYRQAVKLFSSFITCLIYSQSVNIKLSEYIMQLSSKQTDQLVPLMKVMWLKDQNK